MTEHYRHQILIDRCTNLGLSVEAACVIGRESGYDDTAAMCWAIGLEPTSLQPLRLRNWILMAAKSSSVSYRLEISETELIHILTSGQAPSEYIAHVNHLLDNSPAQILVMSAQQVASRYGLPMSAVWANIFALARATSSRRPIIWQAYALPVAVEPS